MYPPRVSWAGILRLLRALPYFALMFGVGMSELRFERGAEMGPAVPGFPLQVAGSVSAAIPEDTQGVQQTIVLMVYFLDTPEPSLPKSAVDQVVFSNLNNFYREVSYNKMSIEGMSYGWYQLPITRTYNNACTKTLEDEAIKAADPDVDFSRYGRLIITGPLLPVCYGGNSSNGKTTFSTADGTVSMSSSLVDVSRMSTSFQSGGIESIGHEFGHGLGANHASLLACGTTAVCTPNDANVDEYGDQYDIMGGDGFGGHLNAPHKDYLGWFDAANIRTVTADGTYTIEPLATATGGLKAIKIPRGRLPAPIGVDVGPIDLTDYLYVEYRQPIGFDAVLCCGAYEGALLHTLHEHPSKSLLLDMSPPTDGAAPALPVGKSFTDPASGATITVTSSTSTGLTVDVSGLNASDGALRDVG